MPTKKLAVAVAAITTTNSVPTANVVRNLTRHRATQQSNRAPTLALGKACDDFTECATSSGTSCSMNLSCICTAISETGLRPPGTRNRDLTRGTVAPWHRGTVRQGDSKEQEQERMIETVIFLSAGGAMPTIHRQIDVSKIRNTGMNK